MKFTEITCGVLEPPPQLAREITDTIASNESRLAPEAFMIPPEDRGRRALCHRTVMVRGALSGFRSGLFNSNSIDLD
jgi:hypothetical protein